MASLSHSIILCSSSAAAGEVSQSMHWVPIAAVINSARTDSTELLAGKYAWKLGCCQWVIPGMMISSRSRRMSVSCSGLSGA